MRRNHMKFHQKPYQILGKLIGNSWQFHGKSWSFGSIPLLTSMCLLLLTARVLFFCWILWGNVRFMFSHGILYPEWDIPGSGWQWACRITAFKIQKLDRRIQEMCRVLLPPRIENSGKSRFVEIRKPRNGNKILGVTGILGCWVDPMYEMSLLIQVVQRTSLCHWGYSFIKSCRCHNLQDIHVECGAEQKFPQDVCPSIGDSHVIHIPETFLSGNIFPQPALH